MALQTLYVSGLRSPQGWPSDGPGFETVMCILFKEEYTRPGNISTQYGTMVGMGLGKTNCCGAKEIWAPMFKEVEFLHVVKNFPTSVFKLNTPDSDPLSAYKTTTIKARIEALNPSLKGVFQFEVETINKMEHIVVMKFDNFAKYLAWKVEK